MDGIARLLIRIRWWTFVGVVAVSIVLVPGLFQLGVDNSLSSFLKTDDPELAKSVAHYGEFPVPDGLCWFGFEADEPLADATLDALAGFERTLRRLTGVLRVTTLLSAPGLAGLERQKLRQRISSSRTFRRLFFAPAAGGHRGALAGLLQFRPEVVNPADRGRVLRAIEAAGREVRVAGRPVALRLAGFPVLRDTYIRSVKADQALFLPLAATLTALLLFLLIPGRGLALATMVVVPFTLAWTFGALGWLGFKMVLLTSTLPTLLMVIAVADAVHVSLRFREERLVGRTPTDAAATAIAETIVPCFLTSLTTIIGFGSLCIANVPSLVQLGKAATLGVGFAFVLTVVLLPASLVPLTRLLGEGSSKRLGWASAFGRLSRWMGHFPPNLVLSATAVVIVVTGLAASRVERDSFMTEDLRGGDEVVRALRWFEERFVGQSMAELLVTAPDGDLFDRETVAELRDVLARVERFDGVLRTLSFVDFVDDGVPPVLLKAMPREPFAMFDTRFETARALVFMRDVGSVAVERYVAFVRDQARQLKHLTMRPVGVHLLANRLITSLVDEVAESFLFALVLIWLLMMLVFRSFRFGLVALVPNCIPLLVTLGFMGIAGIRLRVVVVITFAIALGLAVDNTIHILSRFRKEQALGSDVDTAIGRSLEHVGSAVWSTSLLLLLGFSLLLFSRFQASHDFGLLACLTVLGALAGDLVVLPALLRKFALRSTE